MVFEESPPVSEETPPAFARKALRVTICHGLSGEFTQDLLSDAPVHDDYHTVLDLKRFLQQHPKLKCLFKTPPPLASLEILEMTERVDEGGNGGFEEAPLANDACLHEGGSYRWLTKHEYSPDMRLELLDDGEDVRRWFWHECWREHMAFLGMEGYILLERETPTNGFLGIERGGHLITTWGYWLMEWIVPLSLVACGPFLECLSATDDPDLLAFLSSTDLQGVSLVSGLLRSLVGMDQHFRDQSEFGVQVPEIRHSWFLNGAKQAEILKFVSALLRNPGFGGDVNACGGARFSSCGRGSSSSADLPPLPHPPPFLLSEELLAPSDPRTALGIVFRFGQLRTWRVTEVYDVALRLVQHRDFSVEHGQRALRELDASWSQARGGASGVVAFQLVRACEVDLMCAILAHPFVTADFVNCTRQKIVPPKDPNELWLLPATVRAIITKTSNPPPFLKSVAAFQRSGAASSNSEPSRGVGEPSRAADSSLMASSADSSARSIDVVLALIRHPLMSAEHLNGAFDVVCLGSNPLVSRLRDNDRARIVDAFHASPLLSEVRRNSAR